MAHPAVPRPRSRLQTTRRYVRPTQAGVAGVGFWLPEDVVTSEDVERRIGEASRAHGFVPEAGSVVRRTGVRERRFKLREDDASDLAVRAAERAMADAGITAKELDLIIFASSSQDLVEPATSHLVSHKLDAGCAVFDVKNACNSFMNGMQIADAFIRSGQYSRILVCTGEAPSEAIRWEVQDWEHMKRAFAGYTFGDAGAAAVFEPRQDGTGLQYFDMVAASENWEICTLRGGGTMHPRTWDATFFEGDGNSLRDSFKILGPQVLITALTQLGLTFQDFDAILFHQVTEPMLDVFLEVSGVDESRIIRTVAELGNVASATLPLQLARGIQTGQIQQGSRVLWIGLGAGISICVAVMRM